MKNISIWFNSYGVDECLVRGRGDFSREVLNELSKRVKWLGGWNEDMWKGLVEEGKGEGWVMWCFDGFGVFVVDDGLIVGKCKEEYDMMF